MKKIIPILILFCIFSSSLFSRVKDETLFLVYAEKGDVKNFKKYMSKIDDLNVTTSEGQTALIIASKEGNEEIVRILLANKFASVNIQDEFGMTALTWAVSRGHVNIVNMLIRDTRVNPNIQVYGDKATALSIASVEKTQANLAIMQILLYYSYVNIDMQDASGMTALMYAASDDDPIAVEMVKLLLNAGANVYLKNSSGDTVLDRSIALKYTEIADLIRAKMK